MPSQTWVARFVVDHGRVTEEGGLLRSFPRRRIDEIDVDLHILAEPAGIKGEDLGAQAVENIGRLFLEDRLSLTGGVMRALRSTHATLLEWNRRSIPREQVTTGVTAAAVSGALVYLFQAGPGLCFRGSAGGNLQLLPAEDADNPLGEGDLEPCLRRIDMTPGDFIVAASRSLLDVADMGVLESLFARGTDEALPELYLLTKDLPSFALMAITCLEPDEAALLEPEEEVPAGDLTRQPTLITAIPAEPVSREAPALFADDEPARPAEPASELRLVSPPPVDISRTVVKLRSDQGPSRGSYARTTSSGRGFRLDISQGRILTIAGAVAIVLFVGAFAVPDLLRENRQERIAVLLQSAQVQLGSGAVEENPTRRRQYLEDASTLSAEILRLDPQHVEAATLRQQALGALAQLNAVFDLGPMTTVTTLSRQVTGEVSFDAMLVAAGNAFILDSRGGRILSVPLNGGQVTTVFSDGSTYGGTPAKKPQFFAWEANEQSGRLLVLDGERKLFAIRPGSPPEPLALRRTNTWTSVAGIAAFGGNLYILDPSGNKVHRYLPAANGFDSEPESILSGQADLKDAIQLAVDGEVYVLKRTGQVLRFTGGAPNAFNLDGIDRPLTGPNALQVVSQSSEVFIADSGNKRVVVAGKDGIFRRQLTSSAFTDVRAMGVDPLGGQLYVIVGDALLTAPLVR